MNTVTLHHTLSAAELDTASAALLAQLSGLSKSVIKDAMAKGAVWLQRGKSRKRLRRATYKGQLGDQLHLHYDAALLRLVPPVPQLLADERRYSVWLKPAGLLAQGTLEGDHCALLRLAEIQLGREAFLVHRLDREAAGLMLIAHDGKAAAAFSGLFAEHDAASLRKTYQVLAQGKIETAGEISSKLDAKTAVTRYRPLRSASGTDATWLEVSLITGRKHQIRRHLASIGHPVLGDPRYGKGNACTEGLQLYATELAFTCPLTRRERHYHWTPPSTMAKPATA